MTLFQLNTFRLHSGEESKWKIDCDFLTFDDYSSLAYMASTLLLPVYDEVVGVPDGGMVFAAALSHFVTPGANQRIIADDVLTTGQSMRDYKQSSKDLGIVVFSRGHLPHWVKAIFKAGWL